MGGERKGSNKKGAKSGSKYFSKTYACCSSKYSARRSQEEQCCGATHALLCGRCPSDARKGAEPKRQGLRLQAANRAVRVSPEVKDSNFLKDTIKVLLASPC